MADVEGNKMAMARAKRKSKTSDIEAVADQAAELDTPASADDSAAIQPVEFPAASQEVATLEAGGDFDEASAEVVDTELAQLMKTPLGLRGAVEALLFSSPDPLTVRRMCNALAIPDSKSVSAAVQQLRDEYEEH